MRLDLKPHSTRPPAAARAVDVIVRVDGDGGVALDWRLDIAPASLIVPAPARPERRDGLWRTTCVEMFLKRGEDAAYLEFNFSPSGEWAAYRFAAYRDGAAPVDPFSAPALRFEASGDAVRLQVNFDPGAPPPTLAHPWRVGLSAVIEETGGTRSYWALAHPGAEPDFHHAGAFALTLLSPEAAR